MKSVISFFSRKYYTVSKPSLHMCSCICIYVFLFLTLNQGSLISLCVLLSPMFWSGGAYLIYENPSMPNDKSFYP